MNNVILMNKSDITLNKYTIFEFVVVVIKDLLGDYKIYFSNEDSDNEKLHILNKFYTNIESDIVIGNYNNVDETYESYYGEIVDVIPFADIIITYNTIKSNYSVLEINEMLENFAKDYIKIKDINVKKLKK